MSKCNLSSTGGSLPPTKKDKSSEVHAMCVSCNKAITENRCVKCCSEWEHRQHSGVSVQVYDVLSDDPCPVLLHPVRAQS